MDESSVDVFDTTLRDGEQAPGLSFSTDEKVEIAKELDDLGVDTLEAGFPRSSSQEKETVSAIGEEVGSDVCALARIDSKDVRSALETDPDMVHVFASTSKVQIEKSMKMTRDEVLDQSVSSVKQIKDAGKLCMFSPMDATRTERDYLESICGAVEEAGADVLNIPDTVGVCRPGEMKELISRLREIIEMKVSVHCHDDFGLAVANTVAAVQGGAEEVQVTVNGIGERAGNAALEETVMALECLEERETSLNTESLYGVSKLVERTSGLTMPPNKSVVGKNAFSHESGIHAAGVMNENSTFEPGMMSPEMVGHKRRFVVGKHAGKKGMEKILNEAGLEPDGKEVEAILEKVKSISENRKRVTETDVYAIAETEMENLSPGEDLVELRQVFVTTGDSATPTATVEASIDSREETVAATGVGPVDAVFKAMKKLIGTSKKIEISEFHIDAITGGSDAVGNVTVKIEDEKGKSAEASGIREDIVIASVEALLNAVNHLARK